MFEHYLRYQSVDPRRQRMMGIAAAVSGTLTLTLVTFAWAANKMDVTRVDAPSSELLVFQLTREDPPPPPPPPPSGGVQKPVEEETREAKSEELPPDEPPEEDLTPREAPSRVPAVTPRGAGPRQGIPGLPAGPGGLGIPGGRIGMPIGDPIARPTSERREVDASPLRPIEAVMAQAVFKPDPDKRRLSATKAAIFDKRPCTNQTSFCIDASGKVVELRTKKSCYDPQVDAIVRETLAKWRFRPFVVGGKAQRTCTTARFDFQFEG